MPTWVKIWKELPHPTAILHDPENAEVPQDQMVLIALCGALFRMADDVNFDAIVTFGARLRREVGEFLVGSCIRRDPGLQRTPGFIRWAAAQTQ